MTTRELWQRIMHYGEFDRMPVVHWTGWKETRARWIAEGMPADANEHEYFGAVPMWTWVGVNIDLFPRFEEQTLEETPDWRIYRDHSGVIKKEWKNQSCIPNYIDHTLRIAADWPEFKRRLLPGPERIPGDLDGQLARAEASGLPIVVGTTSLMGWIRNWMGVENMCYLMADDPDCYTDMVNTLADLACWGIDQTIPRMKTRPDMGFGWEDICGKTGPLVSPGIFERCVAPGYRRIRRKLEDYGVKLLGIDTDGDIAALIGPWFEAGVNVQFPVEIGTWNADPLAYRREFGRELRIVGGFNKLVLEQGPDAIDAEIERRRALMKDGGFLLMPDHLITPGTSLENYKYYLDRIRDLRL